MKRDKLFAVALVVGIMTLAAVISVQAGDPVKVNINTASAEQLAELKGIGPSHAAGIVEYRQKNGAFKSPEDLIQVSGIGPKTLEKNQGLILVEGRADKPPKK